MREVTDLQIYNLAEILSDKIWHHYDLWPTKARRTLGYQIIDSSDSIAANIAEGFGRYTSPDKRRFYHFARGSFEETKCWLRKASRRELISVVDYAEYNRIIDELGPKLNAFIRNTNR